VNSGAISYRQEKILQFPLQISYRQEFHFRYSRSRDKKSEAAPKPVEGDLPAGIGSEGLECGCLLPLSCRELARGAGGSAFQDIAGDELERTEFGVRQLAAAFPAGSSLPVPKQ